MRRVCSLLLVSAAAALGGCGNADVEGGIEKVRERADRLGADVKDQLAGARKEFDERRERFGRRIREVTDELDRAFERPAQTSPVVRTEGRNEPLTIDAYLTDVLKNIDAFWTRTFEQADLPAPRVAYEWVPPGRRVNFTGCGIEVSAAVAQYCPGDDTIYVGQQFAADIYRGVAHGFPGEAGGNGRAAGDFAVAYIVAHEYAHNLQQELGIFDNRPASIAKPYELHADCFAGVWAYSVFAAGDLQPGDLEEAASAALAVGDFEDRSTQHHGRPEERRDALLTGYDSGRASACDRYLPV
jgi:uncharacterized protein